MWCVDWSIMQLEDYQEELEEMKNMTRQEYVAHLRRYCTLVFLSSTKITILSVYVHHLPGCRSSELNIQFDQATKQLLAS